MTMQGQKVINYLMLMLVLSQWRLKQEDETLAQYIQRVKQSKLWTTKDNGFYDLTTEVQIS